MKYKIGQKLYMPQKKIFDFSIIEIIVEKIVITEKGVWYNDNYEKWLFPTVEEAIQDLLKDLKKEYENNIKTINNLKAVS